MIGVKKLGAAFSLVKYVIWLVKYVIWVAIEYIPFRINRIYMLNVILICKLYTKNTTYIVYKLIFNSSKLWGGANPSWTSKETRG